MGIPPEEIERLLLSSITKPKQLVAALGMGIREESFIVYGSVWTYLVDYYYKYTGKLPRRQDIELHFKGTESEIELETAGEVSFYMEELSKAAASRQAKEIIRNRLGEQAKNLEESPFETISHIIGDLRQVKMATDRNMALFDRDALKRMEYLEERIKAQKEGRVVGIPTGLAIFDDVLHGWGPGEFIYVMGPKGIGKSWLLLYFACVAYASEARVLFVSPEMSHEEVGLRFDVVLASHVLEGGAPFSHDDITTGQVDQKVYKKWLEGLAKREDFLCVDSSDLRGFTTTELLGLISEHHPDITIVDGLHLMVGEHKGQKGWEIIKEAGDSLKSSAMHYKNVVIASGQVTREAMQRPTEPATSGAESAYAKGAVEACNRLITMAMYAGDATQRVFKVPHNRGGKEYHRRQRLIFDVNMGKIGQVQVQAPGSFDSLDSETGEITDEGF